MIKFNRVAIRDPWVNNIEGATLLVPDGWRLEGGFHWMPHFAVQANLLIRVSDPRTGASAEALPAQHYVYALQQMPEAIPLGANWLGSVHLYPPRHPAEFAQAVWMQGPLRHLAGARLERTEDLPQIAAARERALGGSWKVWATRLRYSYQYAGHGWEEDIYPTLSFDQSDWRIMLWTGSGAALRAPAGKLDALTPTLLVPMQSVRLTLEWSAMLEYVRQMFHKGQQRLLANQKWLGQQWAQLREQVSEMHRQVYEEQQASRDRQSFAMREALGGVETYVDPYQGRALELPAGYQEYWVNSQGSVICSETPGDDPRRDGTTDWHQMERYMPYGRPA